MYLAHGSDRETGEAGVPGNDGETRHLGSCSNPSLQGIGMSSLDGHFILNIITNIMIDMGVEYKQRIVVIAVIF